MYANCISTKTHTQKEYIPLLPQPCPKTPNKEKTDYKTRLKIYWARPHPSEQDPVSLSVSLPSGSFHKPLILLHQRADRLKTTVPLTNLITWTTALSNSMKPPKTDESWWRVLTKRGPLQKGTADNFSICAWRTPWTVWKGKKTGHGKMNSPGQ